VNLRLTSVSTYPNHESERVGLQIWKLGRKRQVRQGFSVRVVDSEAVPRSAWTEHDGGRIDA